LLDHRCFLIDYDSNGAENLMAPENMKALVAKHSDASAKVAAEKHELRRQATAGGRAPSLSEGGASGGADDYGSSGARAPRASASASGPRISMAAASPSSPSAPTMRASVSSQMPTPSAPDEPVFIPI
jgi:hypothetical protein